LTIPPLCKSRPAANDNDINPRDIPIADQRHWLGDIERGAGIRDSECHPYRTGVRYGRNEEGQWDFTRPISPTPLSLPSREYEWPHRHFFEFDETDSVSRRRAVVAAKAEDERIATRPHRFRLAVRSALGRKDADPRLIAAAKPLLATESERKWAGEGLPIDVEFKTGRIAGTLWAVLADFADVYETANTETMLNSDHRLDAIHAASFIRYRLMHLWRPLVEAAAFGRTMAEIGRDYGGNKEDSAKLGRQKIIDCLLICQQCFWDMNDQRRKQQTAAAADLPMASPHVSTLGRKSATLPMAFHVAANDNRKAIRNVA
jgi:hypothetical protein